MVFRNQSSSSGTECRSKGKLSWTADKKVTVEINGATVFTAEDFSGIADLGNKIAIKGGSYANASAVTNVYLKNIHYTGQAAAETMQSAELLKMLTEMQSQV